MLAVPGVRDMIFIRLNPDGTLDKTFNNGNGVQGSPPAFTAEQSALLAQPIPDDSQFDEDVLMPSLTPDEQAAIAVEDWG